MRAGPCDTVRSAWQEHRGDGLELPGVAVAKPVQVVAAVRHQSLSRRDGSVQLADRGFPVVEAPSNVSHAIEERRLQLLEAKEDGPAPRSRVSRCATDGSIFRCDRPDNS